MNAPGKTRKPLPPKPSAAALRTAEEIIRLAGRSRPADAVMREVLRKDRRLSPDEKRSVSIAVFAYFRWFGWLDAREPLHEQITQAQQLDNDFQSHPDSVPDAEL